MEEEFVNLNDPCEVYGKFSELWFTTKEVLDKEIEKGGEKKKEIIHGDYGYLLQNGSKVKRLFLKTQRNKIEAFCMEHTKCVMGADVNKNLDRYYVCGNIA